jgi:hypothetical protein
MTELQNLFTFAVIIAAPGFAALAIFGLILAFNRD